MQCHANALDAKRRAHAPSNHTDFKRERKREKLTSKTKKKDVYPGNRR